RRTARGREPASCLVSAVWCDQRGVTRVVPQYAALILRVGVLCEYADNTARAPIPTRSDVRMSARWRSFPKGLTEAAVLATSRHSTREARAQPRVCRARTWRHGETR